MRNPQNTLSNAIQRELHSARRATQPRVFSPRTEKKPSQIQQVGLTLDPRALFFKKSKPTNKKNVAQNRGTVKQGGNKASAPRYQSAIPQPNAKPGQSEIQRQLEALYRRDGRTMPPMDLKSLPKTANSGSASGRGAVNPAKTPSSQKVVGKPQQNIYRQPQQQKKKWYDKFLPAKVKQTPKRLPQSQQIAKKAPVTTPVTKPTTSQVIPELPAAPAPVAHPTIAGSEQSTPDVESVAKGEVFKTEGLDAEELEKLAEKAVESTQNSIVKNPEDEFNNLFPEMSEDEADGKKETVVKTETPKTPFSGLILEEEGLKKSEEKQTKSAEIEKEPAPQIAQENTKKEVNPFEPQLEPKSDSAEEKNLFEVPTEKIVKKEVEKTEDNPFKPQPEQKLEIPAAKVEKKIASNDQDRSIEKKIALIASRGNIKGLKGFCPVALRDNRLLVDARPEFSSSFKSMNYQFASLENKLKFDREPAKYAPAAGGSDIVWLVDQQNDKEGTLDFASWYKGRLYLFSNQKNLDVFMKTPALYVGVE
ncbi:MAG: hypothetical protein QM501_06770 [Gimesia sp.]